jgi:hypothetical protein
MTRNTVIEFDDELQESLAITKFIETIIYLERELGLEDK